MVGGEGRHLRRVGLTGGRIGLRREQLLVEALAVSDQENRNVDHRRSPFLAGGRPEAAAPWRARPSVRPRHAGWPPASEKRPVTGTRPGANTAALDSRTPWPLLSKLPAMQTPLAWLRRKPGWAPPFTCSNLSMKPRLAEAARREPAAHEGKADRDGENAAPIAASLASSALCR